VAGTRQFTPVGKVLTGIARDCDQIAANVDALLAALGTNAMNQDYQVDTAPQRPAAPVDRILARPAVGRGGRSGASWSGGRGVATG
jgi:hypothetical protein